MLESYRYSHQIRRTTLLVTLFILLTPLTAQSNEQPQESSSKLWVNRSITIFKHLQPYIMTWDQKGFQMRELINAFSQSISNHIKNPSEESTPLHPIAKKTLAAAIGFNTLKNTYTYFKSDDASQFFRQAHQNNTYSKLIKQSMHIIGTPDDRASLMTLSASLLYHNIHETLVKDCSFLCLDINELPETAIKIKVLMHLISQKHTGELFLPLSQQKKLPKILKNGLYMGYRTMQSSLLLYSLIEHIQLVNKQFRPTHLQSHKQDWSDINRNLWNHLILTYELDRQIHALKEFQ